MKYVLIIACLCVAALPCAAGDAVFFRAIPDIPLPAGFDEITGESLVFDKEEGRIVQALAIAPVGAATAYTQLGEGIVFDFYAQSLPQLGWRALGRGAYSRKDERLAITIEQSDSFLILSITVAPKP
ncbi:MAG: hypothetical protein ACPGRX_02440 [Bdellovibrionales bacterium]